jgi:hypothetical protein
MYNKRKWWSVISFKSIECNALLFMFGAFPEIQNQLLEGGPARRKFRENTFQQIDQINFTFNLRRIV